MSIRLGTVNHTSGGYRLGAIQHAALSGTLSVLSVTPSNPKPGEQVVTALANAVNAAGKTATYGGVALPLDSQDINSVTVDAWPDLRNFGAPATLQFNTAHSLIVDDAGDTGASSVQTAPEDGVQHLNIVGYTEVVGGPSVFDPEVAPPNGIVNGDTAYFKPLTGQVVIDAEGLADVSVWPASAELTVYDASIGEWSNTSTQAFNVAGEVEGSGAATISGFAVTGSGSVPNAVDGVGAATLSGFAVSGQGGAVVIGQGAGEISGFGVSGEGRSEIGIGLTPTWFYEVP